ncbi:MAG: VOC family protein [Hyphomonadaceae bacterium]|nr:VOC family protein [Hyphomonadaceae bacterium]
MISALDHVALVVRDLDAAVAGYETLLGRSADWRGADGGAAHAWFQLENTALDVIAPTGPGFTGDQVKARLDSHGEGLWAIAFAAPDIETARRRLARRGVASTEARPVRSTHPTDGRKRYWNTSVLNPVDAHGVTAFLIQETDETRDWPRAGFAAAQGACASGLDHVVIRTPNPERAAAFYGARLGLDMALDRANPDWGARLMFFRCGDLIVEVAHDMKAVVGEGPDSAWGLSWRTPDADAMRARLAAAGANVSDVRVGRKPGTRVFTVRDAPAGVPTIVVEPAKKPDA